MKAPRILSRRITSPPVSANYSRVSRAAALVFGLGFGAAALPPFAHAATITWNGSQVWDANATDVADTVQIGVTAGSRALVTLSTDDAITRLNGVGGGGTGAGAVYQTGGNLVISEAALDSNFSLGGIGTNAGSGYGYYNISGGSLQGGKLSAGGRAVGAIGVFDITGGAVTATEKLAIARGNAANSTTEAASYGLINVTGGTVVTNTVTAAIPSVEMGYFTNGYGVFNVGGGAGTATVTGVSSTTNGGLDLGNQINAGTTVANLLAGGTLTVSRVFTTSAATVGTQLLNFNGGTLKATAANFGANFLTDADIDAVTVYSGGGTIDNSGTAITISRPLTGASGAGVTTIAVTDGGSGYVGAPIVQITGGTGNGATAVANMVDDGTGNGTFKIGSITITSAGTYSDTTGLAVSLRGGGALSSAAIGNISTASNTGGGMTFTGGGTTIVTGANTYTGKTVINTGTLQVGANERIADASVVEINNAAKLEVLNFTETVGGLTTTTPGQAALVQNRETGGTGTGTLIINTAGNDYTFDGIVRDKTGVLAVQKTGAGTQTLTYSGVAAPINFTGGLTINGGAIKLSDTGNGRTIGSFASNVVNNATLVLENMGSNNQTFAKAISGTGGLVVSAPNFGGSVTLSAANTYTGATTINDGTLLLTGSGSIANSSGVLLNNGAFVGQGSVNSVTVANSASNTLSNAAGSNLTTGALSFNGAATVNLTYAGTPAIAVTGALVNTPAAGQVTINGSAVTWANGLNNLISFGSFTGSLNGFLKGDFTGLSGRQIAESLKLNGNNIALNVIGDNALWTGANGGVWQQYAQNSPTSAAPAWKLQTGGTTTDFWMSDNAVFDDTATGTTTATLHGGSITANTVTFNNSAKNYTITTDDGSSIAGGLLIKNGTGKLTINNANFYAGGTTLNAGTLVLNDPSAIGFGTLTINGGTLDNANAIALAMNNAQNWNGDFSFAGTNDLDMGNGAVTAGGTGNRVVSINGGTLTVGELKTAAGQGFTKQGPGTLVLTSTGNGTAASVVNGTLNVAGGTIQINRTGAPDGNTSGDLVAGGLTGNGTITNGAAMERWIIVNGTGNSTFGGTLTNGGTGGLGLSKQGTGTLTISSTNNTYTGQTVVEGGILNVATLGDYGVASSIGARSADQEVATNVGILFRGGTLQYTGSVAQSTNRQIRISTVGGGTIDASGSNPAATLSFTYSGTNTDLYENGGTRTLTLTGSNTGDNTFAIALNNESTNATSLVKTGAGKWILTGAGNYTGTTTVRQGTLTLTGSRTGASGGFTIGDTAGLNATLNITNGDFNMGTSLFTISNQSNSATVNQTGGSVTMGGTQMIVGNLVAGSTGTYNLSGGTLTGAASANRGVILGTNAGTTGVFNLSGTGNLALGSAALQVGRSDDGNATNSVGIFNQTGGTAAVGTLTIGGGTGTTNNSGASGTLNLTGGTFSATNFTLLAAATNSAANMTIGGTAQVTLPAFPTAHGTGATANVTFDGGTLSPAAASAAYMGGLTNAFLTANGAKFSVATGNDITVSQVLQDAVGQKGTLTKLGAGVLTLSGANTYTGATVIDAGSLALVGSISGSASITARSGATFDVSGLVGGFSLANGQALKGSGTIIGAVAMSTGSKLAPGEGAGVLTFLNDLNLSLAVASPASAALQFDLGSVASDKVQLTLGSLSIGSGALGFDDFAFTNIGGLASGTYTLFDTNAAIIGSLDPNNLTGSIGSGFAGTLGFANGGQDLVLTVVPEPSSATLLLMGMGTTLGLRRFRRRAGDSMFIS